MKTFVLIFCILHLSMQVRGRVIGATEEEEEGYSGNRVKRAAQTRVYVEGGSISVGFDNLNRYTFNDIFRELNNIVIIHAFLTTFVGVFLIIGIVYLVRSRNRK